MLLYVSIKVAWGSVSFPRLRGKVGMGDSAQRPANPQKVKNPQAGETSLRYQILDA